MESVEESKSEDNGAPSENGGEGAALDATAEEKIGSLEPLPFPISKRPMNRLTSGVRIHAIIYQCNDERI